MLNISDIIASINSGILIKDSFLQNATFCYSVSNRIINYSGGFTIVFPCYVNNEKWAFRCWHATLNGSPERFKLLSQALKSLALSYFSEFVYVESGIVVNGLPYPTTRMKWIDGEDLKTFVWKHRKDRACLIQLGLDFLAMTEKLHSLSIAHGDLQHANIIIDNDRRLHLIDYDSIFVPGLESIDAKDIIAGKPDYQHPARSRNVYANEKLDYFSEAIILCSILAIAYKPKLAEKYDVKESDALLFTRADFDNFSSSAIYRDLSEMPGCVSLLREVVESYLVEDDINRLVPINKAIRFITNSYAPFEVYITDSEAEYQNHLRELEKRREQERIAAEKRKDNSAWAVACRGDTENSYATYLRNYPDGSHREEARSRIDKLKEEREKADEQLWMRSRKINMASAYEKYLQEFPCGLHIAEARRRRDECRDCEDWEEAIKANTERAITSYLANHPSGRFAENAKLCLKRNKEEEQKWKWAENVGTISSYKTYLTCYPNGKYAKQAKKRMDAIQKGHRKTICYVALFLVSIILPFSLSIMYFNGIGLFNVSTPRTETTETTNYHHTGNELETTETINRLDKILNGMEQAKKEGQPINSERLGKAEGLLNSLQGTSWYDRYHKRLENLK